MCTQDRVPCGRLSLPRSETVQLNKTADPAVLFHLELASGSPGGRSRAPPPPGLPPQLGSPGRGSGPRGAACHRAGRARVAEEPSPGPWVWEESPEPGLMGKQGCVCKRRANARLGLSTRPEPRLPRRTERGPRSRKSRFQIQLWCTGHSYLVSWLHEPSLQKGNENCAFFTAFL